MKQPRKSPPARLSPEELFRAVQVYAGPPPADAPAPDDPLLSDYLRGLLPEGDATYVKLMLGYSTWRNRLVELAARPASPPN